MKGSQPYGYYPLVGDKTSVGVADFDSGNPEPAIEFIQRAKHHRLNAYLERSKSKGYHVWLFFSQAGVAARKVRLVIKFILNEIECADTEVFPKQDFIRGEASFGNFINAPLFGRLVPDHKTVFIAADATLMPFADQWAFLQSIRRVKPELIEKIIRLNVLEEELPQPHDKGVKMDMKQVKGYALPICVRRILAEGVTFNQRVACFRLAVHLKRVGLPYDAVVATLMNWREKNRPTGDKRMITSEEIAEQVRWAFRKDYSGYGCNESVLMSFCDYECPLSHRIRDHLRIPGCREKM
ncbi:hypothetical protein IIA29_09790 [candidate division KSB1 bacterium]|nr:hypothetical protein [candidate division KSB1 bacterium]